MIGGLILWLLRLALAPASTVAGFRAWVLSNARSPPAAAPPRPAPTGPGTRRSRGRRPRPPGSFLWSPNGTAHSPPSPLIASPRSAPHLAPHADLNTGAARAALRKAVLAARNGDTR